MPTEHRTTIPVGEVYNPYSQPPTGFYLLIRRGGEGLRVHRCLKTRDIADEAFNGAAGLWGERVLTHHRRGTSVYEVLRSSEF